MLTKYKETVAGAGAGILGTSIGYPFDLIKGRMQTTSGSSMLNVATLIYRDSGLIGFFRGITAPLLSLTILNMTNFSSYAIMTNSVVMDPSMSKYNEPRIFVAGAAVGTIASLISTPFEFIKLQVQFSSANRQAFTNSKEATKLIFRNFGPKFFYRGFVINTVREMTFLGTYFYCYENFKHILGISMNSSLSIPLSGGLAGAIGWFVSYPLDCIKTNIQNIDLNCPESRKGKSIIKTGLRILKEKGILKMYSGVLPSILRAFIVSSTRFTAYESIIWILSTE